MDFEKLTANLAEEQIAKARACATPSELIALAEQEGIELSDEQLDAVNGGASIGWLTLPDDYDSGDVWKNLPTGAMH